MTDISQNTPLAGGIPPTSPYSVGNKVVASLGNGDYSTQQEWYKARQQARDAFIPGRFLCPHGACFDHRGNIFVVEWVEVGRVTKLRKIA